MANVKVLASGSSGNCYILESCDERLIIECGVGLRDVIEALRYDLAGVRGGVYSHKHQDHYNPKTAVKLQRLGVRMYGVDELTDKTPVTIGGFTVMPLAVPHGDCDNFAYVIDMPNGEGRVLFATDLEQFPYNIPDVNFMLIEANYDENIVRMAMLDNDTIWNASETHMEIDTAIGVISRHLTADLRQVVLIHLSAGFSDEAAFVGRVEDMGVPCVAAKAGMEIEMKLYPF